MSYLLYILLHLPSLSLEKIYAAVTYYLHHRTEMNKYLSELSAWREHRYLEEESPVSPQIESGLKDLLRS